MNRIEETLHIVEAANIVSLFNKFFESVNSLERIVSSLKETEYTVNKEVLNNMAVQISKLNSDIDGALEKANDVLSKSTYENLFRDFEMSLKQFSAIETTLKRTGAPNGKTAYVFELLNMYKAAFKKIGNKLKYARNNLSAGNVNGSGLISVGQSIDSKGGMVQVSNQSYSGLKNALNKANKLNTGLDNYLNTEKENSLV